MARFLPILMTLLLLSVPAQLQAGSEVKRGVSLSGVLKVNGIEVQPGQIVSYVELQEQSGRNYLVLDGKPDQRFALDWVIPLDPLFSPSRIYLLFHSPDRWYIWSEDRQTEITNRYLLLKNTCGNFPKHPLREELLAMFCRESENWEAYTFEGKTDFSPTREAIREYLKEYPRGRHSDEFRWELVKLENYQYEYEGNPETPVLEIRAYEKFLKENPGSTVSAQIRLKIATLCRIASECIADSSPEWLNSEHSTVKKDDEVKFRERARVLFTQLLKLGDIQARETARVNLFNMDHQRNCYAGKGGSDW